MADPPRWVSNLELAKRRRVGGSILLTDLAPRGNTNDPSYSTARLTELAGRRYQRSGVT